MPPATGIRPKSSKGTGRKTVSQGNRTLDFSGLSSSFSTGSVKPSSSGDALTEQANAALKSMAPKTKTHHHATDHSSVVASIKALKLNLAAFRYSAWLDDNQLRRTGPWVAIGIAILLRWAISLGPYSGRTLKIYYQSLLYCSIAQQPKSMRAFPYRYGQPSSIWRLRGSEALDGIDIAPTPKRMVLG